MKKKLFLTAVMVVVALLSLTLAVSSTSVHNENTVDYDATVTLDNGTVCNLFDADKDALIWYLDSTKAVNSVKAQSERVKYSYSGLNPDYLINVEIDHDGNGSFEIPNNNIVVLNLMDDDIFPSGKGGKTNEIFNGYDNKGANIEYVYLNLNTTNISGRSFAKCKKLKYVNLESLINLEKIGAHSEIGYNYGGCFSGCSSLFKNQLVDLSKTQLYVLSYGAQVGEGNFQGVPLSGIKFPSTLRGINQSEFNNCTNLTTVYFIYNSNFYEIGRNVFNGCTNLEKIFFVGTEAQLLSLTVNSSNNDPFFDVFGENNANVISYKDYTALADKSGKYAVYDYSSCAYYGDIHEAVNPINACVGTCTACGASVVNHVEKENLAVSITYSNYALTGVKAITCKNVGCGHSETVEAEALFVCHGYSAPENGRGGIAIGFTVNNEAIDEFTSVTGKTLLYGVFAVAKEKLGDNDIFDKNGKEANGVINAEITGYKFSSFELKIVGFTDEYKDVKIAMGAYAKVTDGESTEYSYMQSGTPIQGEKYCFVSFDEIVNAPSNDSEVA